MKKNEKEAKLTEDQKKGAAGILIVLLCFSLFLTAVVVIPPTIQFLRGTAFSELTIHTPLIVILLMYQPCLIYTIIKLSKADTTAKSN